tara:strand:+ start:3396 stop:4472 length:1077 start_codon:yes stop_codon:yes gene_type:complete
MDSIDAVIAHFCEDNHQLTLKQTYTHPIPDDLKTQSLQLSQQGTVSLQTFGELDHRWGILFAQTCQNIIQQSGISKQDIKAIGSHGQTLWHSPQKELGFSLQVGDPNIIAKQTQITTISDFRRGDMALGGQGAPLAPIFHHWLFAGEQPCVLLNLGGIANITVLTAEQKILGFDTGPANGLLDSWVQEKYQRPYDQNGQLSQQGKVIPELLHAFLADPYFQQPPPKSTGKDYFNLAWIEQQLKTLNKNNYDNQDILCTLTHLTAQTIAQDIKQALPQATVIVCGGGAENPFLLQCLNVYLGKDYPIKSTAAYGIDPKWIEASCFAWLAKQRLNENSLDLRSITGVREKTLLGGIYAGG